MKADIKKDLVDALIKQGFSKDESNNLVEKSLLTQEQALTLLENHRVHETKANPALDKAEGMLDAIRNIYNTMILINEKHSEKDSIYKRNNDKVGKEFYKKFPAIQKAEKKLGKELNIFTNKLLENVNKDFIANGGDRILLKLENDVKIHKKTIELRKAINKEFHITDVMLVDSTKFLETVSNQNIKAIDEEINELEVKKELLILQVAKKLNIAIEEVLIMANVFNFIKGILTVIPEDIYEKILTNAANARAEKRENVIKSINDLHKNEKS